MAHLLRPFRPSDAGEIAASANNKNIADNLRDAFVHPYTLADAAQYIGGCLEAGEARQCCRVIEVDGAAAGSIGIFLQDDVYRKSAEIGYWLAEPYWGRGIMRACIREMTAYAFAHYDIARIYAGVFAYNMGSRRALEHAGFTLEGVLRKSVYKNGALHDSCMYAMVRGQGAEVWP